mgnify:CR=1 FL=1
MLLKGRWVEVDAEKLGAVLARWQQVQEQARNGGVSFGEAMRMLSGAELDRDDPDADDARPVPEGPLVVEYADVRFAYSEHRPVLDGASLRCEPGTVTAIAGVVLTDADGPYIELMAGGFSEFANTKRIVVIREEAGGQGIAHEIELQGFNHQDCFSWSISTRWGRPWATSSTGQTSSSSQGYMDSSISPVISA